MPKQISDETLDRLCWTVVSTRNTFYPMESQALNNVDANDAKPSTLDDAIEQTEGDRRHRTDRQAMIDGAYVLGRTRGRSIGYHEGMFDALNMMMDCLYSNGLNVMARANRYVQKHNDAGYNFTDGPLHAVEDGAEVEATTSDIYAGIIESLDWNAYSLEEDTDQVAE